MRNERFFLCVLRRAMRARGVARTGQGVARAAVPASLAQPVRLAPSHDRATCGDRSPAAATLYILASALGAGLCIVALIMGHGAEIAIKAYVLPCAIVLTLHLGLTAARMSRLNR